MIRIGLQQGMLSEIHLDISQIFNRQIFSVYAFLHGICMIYLPISAINCSECDIDEMQ